MSDRSSAYDSSSDEEEVVFTTCEKCGKQRYLSGRNVEWYESQIRRLRKDIPIYNLFLPVAGLPGCCCLLQKIIDQLELQVGIKQNKDNTLGISCNSIKSIETITVHLNEIEQQSQVRRLLRPLLFFESLITVEICFDDGNFDEVGMLISSHQKLKRVKLYYRPTQDEIPQEDSDEDAKGRRQYPRMITEMPKLFRLLSQLPNLILLWTSSAVLTGGFRLKGTSTILQEEFFPKLKSLDIEREDEQSEKVISTIVDFVGQQQRYKRKGRGLTQLFLVVKSHEELEEVCDHIIANINNQSTSIEELNIDFTSRTTCGVLNSIVTALKFNNKRLKKLTFDSRYRIRPEHVLGVVEMIIDTLKHYNYTISHLDILGDHVPNRKQQSDIDFHLELNRIGRGKLINPNLSLRTAAMQLSSNETKWNTATASRPSKLATRDDWIDIIIKSSAISYSSLFYLIRSKPDLCQGSGHTVSSVFKLLREEQRSNYVCHQKNSMVAKYYSMLEAENKVLKAQIKALQDDQDGSSPNAQGSASNRPKRRDITAEKAATGKAITREAKRLCTS